MTDLKPCAICGPGSPVEPYLEVGDLGTGEPKTLLRCPVCTLVYVDEPLRRDRSFAEDPARGKLDRRWREQFPDDLDVYGDSSWGEQNQDASDAVAVQYRAVVGLLGERLDEPGFRLVELGAARGYLLAEIARHHPGTLLVGVEPSPVMAEHIRRSGAVVVNGVVEEADFAPGSVDAAVAFGAFIQVRDPAATLELLNRCLKPGGALLLDSPNEGSLFRSLARWFYRRQRLLALLRLRGTSQRLLSLIYNPGRFYYYSPDTYRRLLENAGFRMTQVEMRQPRYLLYGKAAIPLPLRWAARIVSWAERASGRQSWVQVAAVKERPV